MEYVFGTKGLKEILKIKSCDHTNLVGWHSVKRENDVETLVDNFHVIRKYNSTEDIKGNCYDWYEIDNHYRISDKTLPIINRADKDRENTENALCELDEVIEGRLSSIEDAICELDEMINGGN